MKRLKYSMKMAHLIIDVQNRYFAPRDLSRMFARRNGCDPEKAAKEKLFDDLRTEMAQRIAKFSAICREQGIPNLYIMHDISTLDAPQIDPASLGAEQLTSTLLNEPYIISPDCDRDIIIRKHFFDAFNGTNLQETLERLDVEGVFVTGGILSYCVEKTSESALQNGFWPVMLRDMVAPHLSDLSADGLALQYSDKEAYGISSGLSSDIAPMLGVDVSALPPLSEAMKALQEGMDASVFNELGSSATVIESAKAHQAQRAQRNKNASSPI